MSSNFFTSHQIAIQEQARARAQETAKESQLKPKVREVASESKIKLPDGGSANVLFGNPSLYGKHTSIEQMSEFFRRESELPYPYRQLDILMMGDDWQELIDRTITYLSANNLIGQLQVMMRLPKLGLLNLSAEYLSSYGWKLNLSAENLASTQVLLKHRRALCRKICIALDDRVELNIGEMKYEQHD